MGKPKITGSSIQLWWFYKFQKSPSLFTHVFTNDISAYNDLSDCVRDLKFVSTSTREFFLFPNNALGKADDASTAEKIVESPRPLKVKTTKIGQIILRLVKSQVYDSAFRFTTCWEDKTSNYVLHPIVELFIEKFPRDCFGIQLPLNTEQFVAYSLSPYISFNKRCKDFRDELNSSEFKLRCRNFERNSQESKLKLKKAFGRLLRKKKRVYVLRFDLDSLHTPLSSELLERIHPPSLNNSGNTQQRVTFGTLSVALKNRWEALCRGLRRSRHVPELLGHASRLHYFPSIGFRLHVMLIFDWMTDSDGYQLRDSIIKNWDDHLTSGWGVADGKKSSQTVSSFPGCGEISLKDSSRLDEVYKEAIPYLTDMDLYMGRIMKHRTFNMWHSK